MGFARIFCSYTNRLRFTKNEKYIILTLLGEIPA